MDTPSFSEILRNPHFNQFAALLSVAMSPKWGMAYPEVPSVRGTLEYRLSKLVRGLLKDASDIRNDIVGEFSSLIQSIVEASPALFYRVEDYQWFIALMNGDESEARFVLTALFAVSVSRRQFLSAEQVAEATGEGASTWRARAAAGEIIGAFKVAKTWMFSDLALRAYGVAIEPTMRIEIDEEGSEE